MQEEAATSVAGSCDSDSSGLMPLLTGGAAHCQQQCLCDRQASEAPLPDLEGWQESTVPERPAPSTHQTGSA